MSRDFFFFTRSRFHINCHTSNEPRIITMDARGIARKVSHTYVGGLNGFCEICNILWKIYKKLFCAISFIFFSLSAQHIHETQINHSFTYIAKHNNKSSFAMALQWRRDNNNNRFSVCFCKIQQKSCWIFGINSLLIQWLGAITINLSSQVI